MHYCIDCMVDISDRPPNARRCAECARKYRNSRKQVGKKAETDDPFMKVVDPQCVGCHYLHRKGFCNYATMTGRSRLFRHIGERIDINSPCLERTPAVSGGLGKNHAMDD